MRHGGCRDVYNSTGDLAISQQNLGNTSIKSTMVYAKREASAQTKVAQKRWGEVEVLSANVSKAVADN
jgi:hypothetical protein